MSQLSMRTGAPTWEWAAEYLAVLSAARKWSAGSYNAVASYLDTLANTYDDADKTGWAAYSAFLSALPESVYPGSTALAAAMASAAVETDDAKAREDAESWWTQIVGAAELSAGDVADVAAEVREVATEAGQNVADVAKAGWFLPAAGLALGGFLLWRVTR